MMLVPTLPQKKPIICQDNIDLSFELIQIRFPVRLEGRNRGGEIIPERCRNALTVQGVDNWDTLGKACLSTASAVDQRIKKRRILSLMSLSQYRFRSRLNELGGIFCALGLLYICLNTALAVD